MNQNPGTLGRKLGMMQLFNEGVIERVTVIECAAVVLGKRTVDKDGYSALILGVGERKEKHTNKPQLGWYKKIGQTPKRTVKEFRLPAEKVAEFEVGQKVAVNQIFEVGQFVDVQGYTRGRGFSGVMRRHNFAGAVMTHGSHEYKRHGGSIGTNMTPGRTLPGLRMPGHYGDEKVTTHNVKIVKLIPEQDLVLIRGSVPGPKNQVVTVRGAVKKKNAGRPAAK
jgi:large subunit ribosomal protein L3